MRHFRNSHNSNFFHKPADPVGTDRGDEREFLTEYFTSTAQTGGNIFFLKGYTHGVKRPGASALNAGQVGGLRAAEHIANAYPPEVGADEPEDAGAVEAAVRSLLQRIESLQRSPSQPPREPRMPISTEESHTS